MAGVNDEGWMLRAVEVARVGIAEGQSPFGAVIARGNEVVAACHNQVWARTDPTAHAEVTAIRAAAQALGRIELAGYAIFSTCEPCPMCMAAIHWARLDRLVYGAGIADAADAGFHELAVPARTLATMGKSPVRVEDGCLEAECRALFAEWKQAARGAAY